jgi:GR25 family glycosyltransferase involved in LPS biosynthesis
MPPVYYLNLDQHVQRRQAMEAHLSSLQLPYFKRVAALTPQTCNLLMVESPCFRVGPMDIAILCSHVNALYAALEDQHPSAKQSAYFLLLEDDVLTDKFGRAARRRYEELFSGPALGKAYSDLYQDVLKDRA